MGESIFSNSSGVLTINTTTESYYTSEVRVWPISEKERLIAFINNTVYYGILYPVAFCGNLLSLLTVILVLKKKKSIPNLLIGVLAMADLSTLFVIHILSVASMIQGYWIGGENLCRFQSVMAFSYFKLGFFGKANISMDRFIALKYPLKYKSMVTTRRVVGLIIFNILFSIGSSTLTWIIDPAYIHQLETWYLCTNDFSIYTDYKLAIVLLEGGLFILGFIGFVISDIKIVRVMKKLVDRKIRNSDGMPSINQSQSATTIKTEFSNLGEIPSSFEECSEQIEFNPSAEFEVQPFQPSSNVSHEQITLDDNVFSDSPRLSKSSSVNINNIRNGTVSNDMNNSRAPKRKYIVNPKYQSSSDPVENLPERYRKLTSGTVDSPTKKRSSLKKISATVLNRVLSISKRPLQQLMRDRERYRLHKEIQYAKLVLVMVIVFVILWIPLMVGLFICLTKIWRNAYTELATARVWERGLEFKILNWILNLDSQNID